MKTILSPLHSLHWLQEEFSLGQVRACAEKPSRVDMVVSEIRARGLGEIIAPNEHPLKHVERVHAADYVEFLQNCWTEWERLAGPEVDAVASVFCRPAMGHRKPRHIEGKLGYYAADTAVGLGRDSWRAIRSSADSALAGADCLLAGERGVFALCRPAGHHASASMMAGYCYINNVAVAAQYLRDQGCDRVAILDVDYHHGNGTQAIFYERDDVYFVSIHGDPDDEYPFFLGRADETGSGAGAGCNLNCPLPLHTTAWPDYRAALAHGLDKITDYAADVLVVSLGVDTFKKDPISSFKLESADYTAMGAMIEGAGLPTLFAFEGGYAVDDLGVNTVNVLDAFDRAAHGGAGQAG